MNQPMTESALRRQLSDADLIAALGRLHTEKTVPDWVFDMLEETALEFTAKRMQERTE